ncbi:MAG: hypothetical protein H5U37_06480, partial [Caldisericia bacterium]|nr:hypothetical protein [Caldisericia bacterium]
KYYTDIKSFIKEFKINKIGLKDLEKKYFAEELDKRVKLEKSSQFINKTIAFIFNHLKNYFRSQKIFIEADSEANISGKFCDVLLKIYKENGDYHEIVFEIKMKEGPVSFNDIESRIEILKESENRYLYWLTKSPLEKISIDIETKRKILREKELDSTELGYLSYLIHLPEIFNLNEFDFNSLITLIKQSGIDLDLIINPPVSKPYIPEINLDKEIENLLKNLSEEQNWVKKETIIKRIKERGFRGFAEEYLLSKINEISNTLGYKITQDTVRFKIKEIR